MTDNPLRLSINTPPRQVEPWTHVPGHNVGRSARVCSCGAGAPADSHELQSEWRESHLRHAWPVVIRREEDESLESWLARTSDELVSAVMEVDRLDDAAGVHRPVPPGGLYPVITPEMVGAGELVEVLEHQCEVIRARLIRRNGWEDPR